MLRRALDLLGLLDLLDFLDLLLLWEYKEHTTRVMLPFSGVIYILFEMHDGFDESYKQKNNNQRANLNLIDT